LIHEYPGRLSLYHVDLYRLRDSRELSAIGFDELARPDAVVVVEWADRLRPAIPDEALWITLTVTGDDSRRLLFVATGDAAGRCLEAVRAPHR
jgi:tRNA threonylcarbamoyladenosine biosynthesis protein TsaE